MEESLYDQLKLLFVFFVTGFIIGFLFDIFRAQRRALKISDFITYVQDILFWILSGIILIITFVIYTDGQLRSYMVIGMIIGILTYFSFISKYMLFVEVKFIEAVMKMFISLLYPFKKINKIIKKYWKKNHNML